MSFLPRALLRNPAFVAGGSTAYIVGSTRINPAYGANRTAAIPAVGSGHSLVVVEKAGVGTVSGLTDNKGNTYTQDGNAASNSQNVYRCHNITNAPTSLIFTNTNDVLYISVFEVANLVNAGPDVALAYLLGSSVATISRSITTLASNSLIIGGLYVVGSYALSAAVPTGVTLQPTMGTAASWHGMAYVQPTAAAVSVGGTWGTTAASPSIFTLSYASL